MVWYPWACCPKVAATAADTSSAAAGSRAAGGAAAVELAELMVDPMLSRSAAADATISGTTLNDIPHLPPAARLGDRMARVDRRAVRYFATYREPRLRTGSFVRIPV